MITPETIADIRAALLGEIERLRSERDRITNDRNNQLDRLRAAAVHTEMLRARVKELEARPKQCRWHATNEDEYPGVYTTECGHMFSFDEGDRAENGAVYCQYCGGKIVEDAK